MKRILTEPTAKEMDVQLLIGAVLGLALVALAWLLGVR